METDRNLLFGILALQARLIDPGQLVDACTLWCARKNVPLAELLLERGWVLPADKEHVDYLLERRSQKHGSVCVAAGLLPDDVKRSLAALNDTDLKRSLANPTGINGPSPCAATIDHAPEPGERYTRMRLHAEGGLGQVWLARDGTLGREVTLKESSPRKKEQPRCASAFSQRGADHGAA